MDTKFKGNNTWSRHPEYDKGFESGQQSKQAEIDVLKSKLDELTKWAESHIEDYKPSESDSEHDMGRFNAACQVLRKLKGEQE